MSHSTCLLKQAVDWFKVPPEDDIPFTDRLKAFGAAAAISAPIHSVFPLAAMSYLGTVAAPEEAIDSKSIKALAKQMGLKENIVNIVKASPAEKNKPVVEFMRTLLRPAAYDSATKKVTVHSELPRSVLSHELGHAANLGNSPKWRKAQEVFRDPLYLLTVPALAGYLSAKLLHKERPDGVWSGAGHGALTGAVGGSIAGAPVIAEEAMASARGLSALRRIGAPAKEMARGSAKLLAGLLTYFLAYGGMGATIGAGYGAKRHYMDKKKRELEALKNV